MGEARDQTDDETSQREGSVNGSLDKPDRADSEAKVALGAFHLIERFLLIVVALMTLGGVASEIWSIYLAQAITLADILLMFLYTEVMGMVTVFYTGHSSIFVYPIFIAITALARLIILQGKDMAPENILFEAGAILLLSIAAVFIGRLRQS